MRKYETPILEAATAKPYEAQLMQLMQATADGDLISKSTRDLAVENEMVARGQGFNMITPLGIKYLLALNLLHA